MAERPTLTSESADASAVVATADARLVVTVCEGHATLTYQQASVVDVVLEIPLIWGGSDPVALAESLVKDVGLAQLDAIALAELLAVAMDKQLDAEAVAAGESVVLSIQPRYSDPVAVADALAAALDMVRALAAEAVTAGSDDPTMAAGKALQEPAVTSDSLAGAVGKVASEDVAASEALAFDAEVARSDTATTGEALALAASHPMPADTASSSDALALTPQPHLEDGAGTADAIDAFAVGTDRSEAVGVGDFLVMLFGLGVGFVDCCKVNTAGSLAMDVTHPLPTDLFTVGDTLHIELTRPLADGALTGDDATLSPRPHRTDPVGTDEAVAFDAATNYQEWPLADDQAVMAVAAPRDDTVSADELLAKDTTRPASDAASVTDSATFEPRPSMDDAAATSDPLAGFDVDRLDADPVAVADAASKAVTRPQSVDAVTAADDATLEARPALTDAPSAADAIAAFDAVAGRSEAIAVGEFIAMLMNMGVGFVDCCHVSAAGTLTLDTTKLQTDSVTLVDVMTFILSASFDLADGATVADALGLAVTRPLTDSAGTGEARTLTVGALRSDSISVVELIAAVAMTKAMADPVGVSESRSMTHAAQRGLADTPGTGDTITRSTRPRRTDTASLSEALAKAATQAASDSAGTSDSLSFVLESIGGPVNQAALNTAAVNG